jgi:hypothetical protein
VTTDADWLKVEPAKGYFTITLQPKPGTNRARIHVRDKGTGGSKTVRVVVEVEEASRDPKLVLSDKTIDFGDLPAGAKVPPRVVRLSNAGGGVLNPTIVHHAPWLDVKLVGDMVEIAPKPDARLDGEREGEIAIESDGGNAVIRVTAVVGEGPVLAVEPAGVDFGTVRPDQKVTEDVVVQNSGQGELKWSFKKSGNFFAVKRTPEGLTITLKAAEGTYQGAVLITSNGGDATIDVRAKVRAARYPQAAPSQPPQPVAEIGPGRWQIEINAFGVVNSQMVLDFYPNGQLSGQQTLMGFQAAIGGSWGYDPNSKVLSLQLVAQMMGIQAPDFRQVLITGWQGDVLIGQDNNMLRYGFRRIG